jgi:exosome complex component CSL4
MSLPAVATPGQPLAPANTHAPGAGTHIFTNTIVSTIGGAVTLHPATDAKAKPTLTVTRPTASSSTTTVTTAATLNLLPTVNSTVLARVTRINPRQATVSIFTVGDAPLNDEFQGIIRVQDVRATEKDKVKIFESFRPGDIVRALVISLGDQSNYYLSTAQNSLGVVMAYSGGLCGYCFGERGGCLLTKKRQRSGI